MTIGILLLQLGTPDDCDVTSVRRYLKEFLSDPRVIDLPAPIRWLLLHALILPFRPKQSAKAYSQIWSNSGSPLLNHSQLLKEALSAKLGSDYQVELGMRYGNPNIISALGHLKNCSRLVILPLFPQYASASTGSALEKTLSLLAGEWNVPALTIIQNFYNHPGFIKAYAALIQRNVDALSADFLLFSFHGLPKRHIHKSNCRQNCQSTEPCPIVSSDNFYCYRAQCYATANAIAQQLNLSPDKYGVSFQSRLGKTPWIQPYTDILLPELKKKGVQTLAVVCPSFVADCLETLEEIAIRGKEQWLSLGGKAFIALPCLNEDPLWVDALVGLIKTS